MPHGEESPNPLFEHYLSYTASFTKDLPPQIEEHARATPFEGVASFYDYMKTLTQNIYRTIEEGSFESYFAAITIHKNHLLGFLEDWVFESFLAPDNLEPSWKEFVLKDWKYFKFSKFREAVITFKEDSPAKIIRVIPYYGEKNKDVWSGDGIVVDVDELMLIEGFEWEKQKEFLLKKKGNPGTKILTFESEPVPLRMVNTPYYVGDWTLLG